MPATGNKSYHPLSLSIRLRADGFSFYVCDLQTSSLIRGEHFRLADSLSLAQQLSQELTRPDYFNRQIDQCFVLVCTPSTRVPLEEFHREEAAALYNLTFTPSDDTGKQRVAYNILPQLECAEIYAISSDVEEAILQFYPTARFFASRAILMERLLLLEEDQPQQQRRLYVCSEADGYSLYAFDERRLCFANTFHVASMPDALYFVLNVWKQLQLDQQKDSLKLLTSHETFVPGGFSTDKSAQPDGRDEALRQALGEYLLNVEVLAPTDVFPRVPLAREKQVPVDLMALLLNRI